MQSTGMQSMGRLEANESWRLRQLGEENSRLKKIVAHQAQDIAPLKVVLGKKWRAKTP
jgi:hypothetical protein